MRFDTWSVLAAMRFALASIVAVNHLGGVAPLRWLAVVPEFGAFEAILGFLLISGFSIGRSYVKKPEGFLLRRVARLYPIYLASIALTYVASPAVPTASFWWMLLLNILFLNQALTTFSYVGPAWSLSLEFWLYCLAPPLMRAPARLVRACVWGSFILYALYTCGRTLHDLPYYSNLGFGLNLPLLAFVWIAGLRVAREPGRELAAMRDVGLLFGGHMLLAIGIQFAFRLKHGAAGVFFSTDAPGLLARCITLAVVWVVFARMLAADGQTARPSRVLRLLGDISYPLYLIHLPVFALLMRAGITHAVPLLAGALGASFLLYAGLDFYSRRRDKRASLPAAVPCS